MKGERIPMSSSTQPFEFAVDEASDLPLWVQLKRRMAFLIESGHYKPGDQLPTVRGLASEISVNYNTVNKVYLSLAADGYIESVRGRGAFVLELPTQGDDTLAQESEELVSEFVQSCRHLGLSYDDIIACVSRHIKKLEYAHDYENGGNVVPLSSQLKRKNSEKEA